MDNRAPHMHTLPVNFSPGPTLHSVWQPRIITHLRKEGDEKEAKQVNRFKQTSMRTHILLNLEDHKVGWEIWSNFHQVPFKFSISSAYEHEQQTIVILAIPVASSPIETRDFPVTMPWLKLSQNIIYAHHDLEIIVVIRHTAKSSNIEAHMLLYNRFVLKYFDNCISIQTISFEIWCRGIHSFKNTDMGKSRLTVMIYINNTMICKVHGPPNNINYTFIIIFIQWLMKKNIRVNCSLSSQL